MSIHEDGADTSVADTDQPFSSVPVDETPAETAEQDTTEADATETEPEKDDNQKRIEELAFAAREQKRLNKQLQREIEALRKAQNTNTAPTDDIERQIEERAAAKIHLRELNVKTDKIFADGNKEFGKDSFTSAVIELREIIGQDVQTPDGRTMTIFPEAFLEAVTDLDHPHKVLNYLHANQEEAEKLAAMTPHRMALQLAKIDTKVSAKPEKPISKAPAPIKPIDRNTSSDRTNPANMDISDYAKDWEKRRLSR